MSAPTLFGFPLWKGKIGKRRAKKYLRRFRNDWMLRSRAQRQFARLRVGDFVNDCTGLNGRIQEMHPLYRRIASGKGAVLLDIDLTTSNTGCSLCSCSIEPKLSRAEIEQRKLEFSKSWALDESGEPGTAKHWYGNDAEKYAAAVAYAKRVVAEIESGGHIVDEDGQLLKEFDRYSSV